MTKVLRQQKPLQMDTLVLINSEKLKVGDLEREVFGMLVSSQFRRQCNLNETQGFSPHKVIRAVYTPEHVEQRKEDFVSVKPSFKNHRAECHRGLLQRKACNPGGSRLNIADVP